MAPKSRLLSLAIGSAARLPAVESRASGTHDSAPARRLTRSALGAAIALFRLS